MANTVFQFNPDSSAMRPKIRALHLLQEALELLTSERNIEIQRRGDTDGSSDANYARLATAGVFVAGDQATANAAARASFMELDSLWFALNALAAIPNCCAKHGV